MQVVVEKMTLPERGHVEFGIQRSFELVVSSEEAQKVVKRWLWAEVSMLLGTDIPALVIDEQVVWRVPIHLTAPGRGHLGTVGAVDVTVQSGELLKRAEMRELIEKQATILSSQLTEFQPFTDAPEGSIPTDVASAPKVSPL